MRPRGFTLIESLVALVVLSVGLLGAAAMLLGSLAAHAQALRHAAAVNLVRDVAERILANRAGRIAYDTRGASAAAGDCTAACDAAALSAADRAYFDAAARRLFPLRAPDTEILFEPAIGATAPDRYVISLRFPSRLAGATEGVALTVLAWTPVAGGA
jgi:type IV pilus assembly protein PilV